MLDYKVKWSEEDMCYIASSVKYPSIKTHGFTLNEAIEEMKIVMELLTQKQEEMRND